MSGVFDRRLKGGKVEYDTRRMHARLNLLMPTFPEGYQIIAEVFDDENIMYTPTMYILLKEDDIALTRSSWSNLYSIRFRADSRHFV